MPRMDFGSFEYWNFRNNA